MYLIFILYSAGVGRTGTFIAVDVDLCLIYHRNFDNQQVWFITVILIINNKNHFMNGTLWEYRNCFMTWCVPKPFMTPAVEQTLYGPTVFNGQTVLWQTCVVTHLVRVQSNKLVIWLSTQLVRMKLILSWKSWLKFFI